MIGHGRNSIPYQRIRWCIRVIRRVVGGVLEETDIQTTLDNILE